MSASKKWFASVATVLFCAQSALADVVAAWNFNSLTGTVPTSMVADAGQGGLSLTEFIGGLSGLVGTDINASNGDIAGQSLTVTGTTQNTKSLVIDVNTLGKKQLQFSMAAVRACWCKFGMVTYGRTLAAFPPIPRSGNYIQWIYRRSLLWIMAHFDFEFNFLVPLAPAEMCA